MLVEWAVRTNVTLPRVFREVAQGAVILRRMPVSHFQHEFRVWMLAEKLSS